MYPNLAAPDAPRHVSIAARLDEVLFETGAWFAIDADNRRVPGVSVASLAQGKTLIGSGRVATLVGRLRAGFAVFDVDVEGVMGEAITEHLAAWCRERDVWHVVRPSGGSSGRHHVFVSTRSVEADLADLAAHTRAAWRVGRTKVDLRRDVRPLSCPHRRSGQLPAVAGDVRAALASLWQLAETMPSPSPSPRRRTARTSQPRRPMREDVAGEISGREHEARVPRRKRPHRPLEDKWATYLATGRRPAWKRADEPGVDASNSTYELMCTASMVRAGWTHEQAWQAIKAAHPDAMSHARESRQRWTRLVWRDAVASDDAFAPAPTIDTAVWAATQEARARLRACAWRLPVRQRTSLLVVAEVVLRRMETTGSLRVPVPERDLVLDTTIRDRTTIRRCLRLLGREVGTLHRDGLDHRRRRETSFEFEIAPALGGVCEIPPPSLHTPLPSALPGNLTLHHWLTLRALPPTASPTAASLASTLQRCPSPQVEPPAHVVRAQRQVLTDLQSAGLAQCDAEGRWSRPESLPLANLPHADHASARAQVAQERAAWRSGDGSRWERERQIAHRELRERHRHWWAALPPAHRRERLRALATRFDASSVGEQSALKRRLRVRDRERGIDCSARREAWWQAHTPQQQQERVDARLQRWHRLSHPEQVAHARAWSEHRREEADGGRDGWSRWGDSTGITPAVTDLSSGRGLPRGRPRTEVRALR